MHQVQLQRGTLTVSPLRSHADWQLHSLLDFAERINPKRAFLFVSRVLGKHIPVKPSQMQKSYQDLAALIPPTPQAPVTMIAMAETAVGLGAGIFREYQKHCASACLFATTTRHIQSDLPIFGDFLEEHSHAQDQLIHSSHDTAKHQHLLNTKTLIVVDDEISTGKTIANLVSSLQAAGMQQIEQVISISLVDWTGDQDIQQIANIPNHSISLMSGRWAWQDALDPKAVNMPNVNITAQGQHAVIAPNTWGREPTYQLGQAWYSLQPRATGEKILVLGSCEFTWIPFLMAEALEQQGAEVYFSSTTRSPIAEGHAIQQRLEFRDNYGLNIPNFSYNVDASAYDRVILVIETGHESVDPALLQQIPNLEVVSYVA